jgi:phospholipase C
MGLRVPALLVSPYARPGWVDHTQLGYTSALNFIEQNWGVAPLSAREAASNNLTGAFDFAARPRPAEIVPVAQQEEQPPRVKVAIIYWFYGAAAVLGLLLLAFALYRSAKNARRTSPPVPNHSNEEVMVS